jgi:phage I-like protein
LANESGRKKKTPLAPNSGKTPKAGTLTAEERSMAKVFNMSESDYLKYK